MAEMVAIIGVGAVSVLGAGAAETWSGLRSGRRGAAIITRFDSAAFPCRAAALAPDPDPASLRVPPREAWLMGRSGLILLQAARQALVQSGRAAALAPDRLAFFAGMGAVDPDPADLQGAAEGSAPAGSLDLDRFYGEAYREIHPLWPLGMLNNVGFCLAAIQLGLEGENAVFSPGPEAGLRALVEAADSVRSGRADGALAGGVAEAVSPFGLARWHLLAGQAPGGERAEGRPIADGRRGAVPGEGGAVLSLERASSTVARGGQPLAVLAGWGECAAADPAAACLQAMSAALEMGGCPPEAVDLLFAHGDGTLAGDRIEAEAIRRLFGPPAIPPVVCSKSGCGHLGAGAPLLDAALASELLAGQLEPPVPAVTRPGFGDLPALAAGGGPPGRLRFVLINGRGDDGPWFSILLAAAR